MSDQKSLHRSICGVGATTEMEVWVLVVVQSIMMTGGRMREDDIVNVLNRKMDVWQARPRSWMDVRNENKGIKTIDSFSTSLYPPKLSCKLII